MAYNPFTRPAGLRGRRRAGGGRRERGGRSRLGARRWGSGARSGGDRDRRSHQRLRRGGQRLRRLRTDRSESRGIRRRKRALSMQYQAQAEKEPLAVKLADSVGHIRMATNFAWTLNTGYLVLFMQAGFALLTCGLVRKKNAGAPDDAQLRGLRVRVPRLLRGRLSRSSSAPWRSMRRRANLGGTPTLNQFLLGERPVGLPGRQGLLPERPGLRRRRQHADAVRSRVHGDRRLHHRRRDLRAHHVRGVPALRDVRRRASSTRSSAAGCGAAAGCRSWGPPWAWVTATWTSPDRPSCMRSADSARWRWRSFSARASASTARTASRAPFPAHNMVFVVTGTFILLFGWMGFNPGSTLGATDLRISVDRGQHQSGRGRRFGDRDARSGTRCSASRTSRWPATACWPGLVAITAPCAFVGADVGRASSASSPASWSAWACCSTSACSRSTIRAARSRCTATAAGSARSCVGIFADGTYGAGWNGVGARATWARPDRASPACSTATPASSWCSSAARQCAPFGRSASTFVVFKVVNAVKSMRVSPEVELEGLDVPEFGWLGVSGRRDRDDDGAVVRRIESRPQTDRIKLGSTARIVTRAWTRARGVFTSDHGSYGAVARASGRQCYRHGIGCGGRSVSGAGMRPGAEITRLRRWVTIQILGLRVSRPAWRPRGGGVEITSVICWGLTAKVIWTWRRVLPDTPVRRRAGDRARAAAGRRGSSPSRSIASIGSLRPPAPATLAEPVFAQVPLVGLGR